MPPTPAPGDTVLRASARPLVEEHDLVMLDLDGVVYVGEHAVPGAAEHLAGARAAGASLAFVTNNASRTPDVVARHLTDLGVEAATDDVVTSAQAAARLVLERHGGGARVLALGGEGVHAALAAEGLTTVGPEDGPDLLVTGYGRDVRWSELMRAAVALVEGLPWIACNTDHTIPTPAGRAPGHGVQVRMLADFAGVEPVVAGKPSRPLLDETVRRVGGRSPLMVGDRLDTDVDGALAVGVPSLLVLTGVTDLPVLAEAPAGGRPSYVSRDLRGLLVRHPAVEVDEGGAARCGAWEAVVRDGRLDVRPGHGDDADPDDWWRAAATACWTHRDRTGAVAVTDPAAVPPAVRPRGR